MNTAFGYFRLAAEIFAVAGIFYCLYARSRRGPLPVTFRSFDELNAVCEVARWAWGQFQPDDPKRKTFFLIRAYLGDSPGNAYGGFPYFTKISSQDLALLAPFIDEFIAGKGPSLNLPSEYEDWRPAALREFKARMEREGLWPGDQTPDQSG